MPKKKTSKKRRVLSGLAGQTGCKKVSRAAAVRKSGPKKGRLSPGCRFLKGNGARCCKPGSSTKKKTTKKRKTKKKATAKKVFTYSLKSTLPFYKKKIKGKRKLRKTCSIRGGQVTCQRNMSRKRAA
jgi:hypothetical protein